MMVIILLTMLVIAVPTLYVMNSSYVQRVALFIGASQVALLAFTGKVDNQLSDFLVSGFNQAVSVSYSFIVQKVCLIFTAI